MNVFMPVFMLLDGWNVRFKIGGFIFLFFGDPTAKLYPCSGAPVITIFPLLLFYVIDPGPAPRSLLSVFQLDRGFGDTYQ